LQNFDREKEHIMHKTNRWFGFIAAIVITLALAVSSTPALAGSKAEIDSSVDAALQNLMATTPTAKELAKIAKGILVFPRIVKAGFIVGGQAGEGALVKNGKIESYYNTVALSYGLQAGAQAFGYALFFTTDAAMAYLDSSSGWEIGVGPGITIVDEGVARSLSTTTVKDGIYAFFFEQKGLMAGAGLQGSKITRIDP
jgi:lipid-binding SYLF domain-containing protein